MERIDGMTESAPPAAWAPLRIPTFRMLFIAMVVSNIGTWMQMVGAQWLLVDEPNATALIAWIQTAMTLPTALFAIPAGIVADNVDRRRMLIVVQASQLSVAGVLALLVLTGHITPYPLLALLFVLGAGTALSLIPFQSALVELVPREQMPIAASMTGLSANVARAIGPALAGALVASFGTGLVFILNVFSVAVYLGALLKWRSTPRPRRHEREPFMAAFAAGFRYVRHSPHLRKLLTRVALFTAPAQAIWALLPVVAKRQLGLEVGAYGVLLAAIGVGAVAAAMSIPRMRSQWRTNGAIVIGMLAYAVALTGLSFAHTLAQAVPLLVIAGFGWIGTLATISGSVQLYLPGWVRSRGASINTLVLFGGQAAGAATWGWLAGFLPLQQTYWIAAAVIAVAAVYGLARPLGDVEDLDRTPSAHWPEIDLAIDPTRTGGTVFVTIEYEVMEADVEAFVQAAALVRIVRLRTGGYNWQLQRDVEHPQRFIESYEAHSWDEHMLAHDARLTESDRAHEDRMRSLTQVPPRVQHFIRTDVPRL